MQVRVGSCEAELKVAALMSVPRLGFTDNFFCVSQALAPHKIAPIKYTGAFFGQCLQRCMEQVVEDHDVVLCIDYDTIFSARTVEALLTLMVYSGMDAIAPLQTKREANTVMFALPGVTPEEKTEVENDWFSKPVQLAETAHFGCTFIRTAAIKKMGLPWFLGAPNERGGYDGGHVDEDIYFWKKFSAAGNKLGIATHISVGHAELLITWPSRTIPEAKIHQHTTEFWNNGHEPPKDAWGYIK